jgi:hypothetical protein
MQVVLEQGPQSFLAGKRGGLEKLSQLMHLDALVHFPEPLAGLLNRFLRRRVDARLQVAASRQINHEFPS